MSDFWSRRRAAVAAEQSADEQAVQARAEAALEAEQAEKSDEDLLEELGLPDPDSLRPGDDVAGFMAKGVPDRLRRRALRQLWKLNPVLANVDGLVDYGEDFTDAATVVENLQTAYQVGKGMLKHVEALAAQAEADEKADTASTDAPPETAALSEVPPEKVAEPETAPAATDTADAPQARTEDTQPEAEVVITPRPRRMRFDYEES